MKYFKELRKKAGLESRRDFLDVTGVSERTLCDFDNDRRDPPLVMLQYLRLLANGCKFCPLFHHRKNTPAQKGK